MIACQGDHGGWPFATCKSFDHAHGAKTAIDVIAQENRHGMVERSSFHIGLDALGHLPEQVVTTVNIAHAVHPSSIRDTTRSRDRGRRFPKCLEERIRPSHGFGGPHLLVGSQLVLIIECGGYYVNVADRLSVQPGRNLQPRS